MKKIANCKNIVGMLKYMLPIPCLKLIYFFLNRIPRSATNVLIDLDNYIPLLPAFVIPYIIFYPFVLFGLIYIFTQDSKVYMHVANTYSIGLIICYITYLVFQTTVPRPDLVSNDVFSRLLGLIYYVDEPVNALPSIHVLGTTVTMLGLKAVNLRKVSVNVLGWSIILSTMFVKQHGILDVVAGLVLAYGSYYLTLKAKEKLKGKTSEDEQLKSLGVS